MSRDKLTALWIPLMAAAVVGALEPMV
jgi:hypothetical protein